MIMSVNDLIKKVVLEKKYQQNKTQTKVMFGKHF